MGSVITSIIRFGMDHKRQIDPSVWHEFRETCSSVSQQLDNHVIALVGSIGGSHTRELLLTSAPVCEKLIDTTARQTIDVVTATGGEVCRIIHASKEEMEIVLVAAGDQVVRVSNNAVMGANRVVDHVGESVVLRYVSMLDRTMDRFDISVLLYISRAEEAIKKLLWLVFRLFVVFPVLLASAMYFSQADTVPSKVLDVISMVHLVSFDYVPLIATCIGIILFWSSFQQSKTVQNRLNIQLAASVNRSQASAAPVGSVVAFCGPVSAIPRDWMLCDGRGMNRVQFSELFAAIQRHYGAGFDIQGSQIPNCDFNLPDFRGYFLRGVDSSGQNRDPDASNRKALYGGATQGIGSFQDDEYLDHTHVVTDSGHAHPTTESPHVHASTDPSSSWSSTGSPLSSPGSYSMCFQQNAEVANTAAANTCSHSHVAMNTAVTGIVIEHSGGSETRPKNAYVNWIIRVK